MGILPGCRTEIEKNLGDGRVGQGLPQEALLSRLTRWRNKVLFSGPELREAGFWLQLNCIAAGGATHCCRAEGFTAVL